MLSFVVTISCGSAWELFPSAFVEVDVLAGARRRKADQCVASFLNKGFATWSRMTQTMPNLILTSAGTNLDSHPAQSLTPVASEREPAFQRQHHPQTREELYGHARAGVSARMGMHSQSQRMVCRLASARASWPPPRSASGAST